MILLSQSEEFIRNNEDVTLNNIIRSQKVSINHIFVIFKRLATKVPYIRL